jgi:uncharacterized protein YhfF
MNRMSEDSPGIVGGYSVVTDFDGNPQCVIQTTEVRVLPFRKLTRNLRLMKAKATERSNTGASSSEFFIEMLS